MNSKKFKFIKREKPNKKWTHEEINIILNYMKENPELEISTAQIYYKKLIEKTSINVSWDFIRWKVRHLKTTFKKANDIRNSTSAGILESDPGGSTVEGKIMQICPFYNQLLQILEKRSNDQQIFPAVDTGINHAESETILFHDSIFEDDIDLTQDVTALQNTAQYVEVLTDLATQSSSTATPMQDSNDLTAGSSSTATPVQASIDLAAQSTSAASPSQEIIDLDPQSSSTATARKGKELGEKLKKFGQKTSSAYLAAFQAERTAMFKMKFAWEKEKHEKELLLSERKIKLEEEKQQAEIDLKTREVDCKKRKLELKALEIEKDEKLKILQMEKDERIKKFEIEMAYKYGRNENNNF